MFSYLNGYLLKLFCLPLLEITHHRYAITPTGLRTHTHKNNKINENVITTIKHVFIFLNEKSFYQISVALDTGVWLTISGATNSGVPYLQYWASSGVVISALPKSQILTWSERGSAIKMLSG